jgi:hypothetical protein
VADFVKAPFSKAEDTNTPDPIVSQRVKDAQNCERLARKIMERVGDTSKGWFSRMPHSHTESTTENGRTTVVNSTYMPIFGEYISCLTYSDNSTDEKKMPNQNNKS